MKKLIMVDQSDFVNDPVGGSTTFLRTIIPVLSRHFDLHLVGGINNKGAQRRWSDYRAGQARFYGIGSIDQKNRFIPNRLRTLLNLYRCRREVMAENSDLLYFHQMELVLPFLKYRRCKKILHIHGLANPLSVSRFKFLRQRGFLYLFNSIFRAIESHLNLIISVSEPRKSVDEIPIRRTDIFKYLPVCIDDNVFSPLERSAAKARLGIPPTTKCFGYVGRLSKMKGLEESLGLIKKCRDSGEEVAFLIVGDGENKGELENLSRVLGIDDCVHFIPAKRYAELPVYYRASDIFIMSSKAEGFPMVVLEALACGTPVISTHVGAIGEIISNGSNGFITGTDFVADAYRHAATIFSRYDEFSSAARNSINRYRADVVAEEIASLLNAL